MDPMIERKAAALARAWRRGDAFTCDSDAAEVAQRAAELVMGSAGVEGARELRDAVCVRGDQLWLPDRFAFGEAVFKAFVVALALFLLGMMARDYAADQAAAVAEVRHGR